mgnify:CR=1 FL=1
MNGLDVFLFSLIIISMYVGYKRGLIRQITSLVGWLLAVFVAYQLSSSFAGYLETQFPLSEAVTGGFLNHFIPIREGIYTLIAFLILFFGVKIGFVFLSKLINPFLQFPVISTVNQIGGLAFGLTKILLVIFILVNVMYFLPFSTELVEGSFLGRSFTGISLDLFNND